MCHSKQKNRRDPLTFGFSLIEIMIVIVILTTITSIAVPRYANALVRYRVDAAARRVAADFELAQRSARQASASRQMSFTTANDTYQIQEISPLNGPGANYDVDLKDDPYQAQITSANLGGDAVVIFDGYGIPDSGGTVVVQVGSDQRNVVLNADTGKASIQ